MLKKILSPILVLVVCVLLTSCSSLISNVTSGLAEDLSYTILNSDDVETISEGIPAYLIMIDSFLRSSPDDANLLLAASSLNGAFSAFVEGPRRKLLAQKSLDYALRAGCVSDKSLCGLQTMDFESMKLAVDALETSDAAMALSVGTAWASWVQVNSGDWNAIAQLAKVKYVMTRVIELNESQDNGSAHLYMGALETVLPASLGGKPEKGRKHFERAISLSGGQFLMTKVVFAEQYAKLVFDKALHDQLLNEVLQADAKVDGMTLINTVAKQQAVILLAESDDYF